MFSPNGIGMSPDGKTLYVDNTMPEPYIRAYDIASDDSLSHERELYRFESSTDFGRGVPDGLKVDSRGDVWMTGPGGISILSPEGKLLGRIQLPFKPSNVAFGEDLHSVFFASGSTIYRLHTLVAGEKPMYYRK
jgi:gluconolactonase